MNLFIDLDRAQLVAGPSNSGAVTQLSFKRGDVAVIAVTFQQMGTGGYAPVVLPAGTTLKFGLKQVGQYDGSFVVYCDVWTAPTAPATAYTFQPSFNTAALNALLDPDGTVAGDLAQVTLMGEIAWIDAAGNETSTRTFSVVVANDVIKDNEAPVDPGAPGFYTTTQSDARYVARALTGVVALTVGQTAYAVDLTALGLGAAPRGALFNLVTPSAAEGVYGARMVTSLTTAVSLALETDEVPNAAGCALVYLVVP